MLPAEDRFVIKDLYRKGVSISEIARQTGHDRKTVRKIATSTQPITVERATAPRRVHKLDPFVPYLERRVAEGCQFSADNGSSAAFVSRPRSDQVYYQ